jgi:hypothetical protein
MELRAAWDRQRHRALLMITELSISNNTYACSSAREKDEAMGLIIVACREQSARSNPERISLALGQQSPVSLLKSRPCPSQLST